MDWQCKCTTVEHKHPDKRRPKPAVTADGYCQECHDKAAKKGWTPNRLHKATSLSSAELNRVGDLLPEDSVSLKITCDVGMPVPSCGLPIRFSSASYNVWLSTDRNNPIEDLCSAPPRTVSGGGQ